MCGIVAIIKSTETDCSSNVLNNMRDMVASRGPDGAKSVFLEHGSSEWAECHPNNSDWQIGLGHRRLSILDLSSAGDQPMLYQRRFWIVYNGEVYNFVELRVELEKRGHVFTSASDTEVILGAFAEWGVACFSRFRGMWGLILVDTLRNEAILCRDRLGIKPLYLWSKPGLVAITSELKQFLTVPGFRPYLNSEVATEYLQTGYEDPDQTFFRQVRPIPAGTFIRLDLDSLALSACEPYWHPERVNVDVQNETDAARLFTAKLRESIQIHLRSDVPVGCALSGGLDSSAIAVLIDELNDGNGYPLHTYTVTFPGDELDERDYVESAIAQIRAAPCFVTPQPDRFLDDLKHFIWIHDEPVGSLSMYASYCMARLTHESGIKVILNGQGGDEVLSAYWQTYFLYLRDLGRRRNFWTLAEHLVGAMTGTGNPALVAQVPVMLQRYRMRRQSSTQIRLRSGLAQKRLGILEDMLAMSGTARRVYEVRTMFLPRLLKWDDRNLMAFSVEGRYPFLDHELIELCLSFAPHTLYYRGWTKWPLRTGLRHILPPKIARRHTKNGFETPQEKWLTGPLYHSIEEWMGRDRPIWGYVERGEVEHLWRQVVQSKKSGNEFSQALFRLLVFDLWLEQFQIIV